MNLKFLTLYLCYHLINIEFLKGCKEKRDSKQDEKGTTNKSNTSIAAKGQQIFTDLLFPICVWLSFFPVKHKIIHYSTFDNNDNGI